ncbi:unnamed protein product [Arabis nemorensis]|uniref:Uncharacterized protein n=1 Tax=Arabis nemorensis TaxID=586526 RepID=A0A565BGM4_9BRAS|nr:unnamed protein product [Arabis nemorensis]
MVDLGQSPGKLKPLGKVDICKDKNKGEPKDEAAPSLMFLCTRSFSDPIPNCHISKNGLKKLIGSIPTLDELFDLIDEILKAELIVVENDKKVFGMMQLITTIFKGMKPDPSIVTKEIAKMETE